jgi:hypothetical protein
MSVNLGKIFKNMGKFGKNGEILGKIGKIWEIWENLENLGVIWEILGNLGTIWQFFNALPLEFFLLYFKFPIDEYATRKYIVFGAQIPFLGSDSLFWLFDPQKYIFSCTM